MCKPNVSIVVPIYNIAPYIERCVDSVLAQTYTNWELILVDDGAKDESSAICDIQVLRDSRIRVIHKENQGVALARKMGVDNANGDWIMFVDGDDYIPQDSLENLLKYDNGSYDLIGAAALFMYENKQSVFKHQINGECLSRDYIIALLNGRTMSGPWNKLIKKNCLKKCLWDVDKRIFQNEDLLMLLDLAINIDKVYIANDVVCYNYIIRNDGVSQSKVMPLSGWSLLFEKIDNILALKYAGDNDIFVSEYKCKLKKIFENIWMKKVYFDFKNVFFSSILVDANKYYSYLTNKEKFILFLLKKENLFFMHILYYIWQIKKMIKTISNRTGLLSMYYKYIAFK